MKPGQPFELLLFDLDGTLIDSAPDLAGAGDDMRVARGLPPLGLAAYRPMVGSGARGMVGIAFGIAPDAADYSGLRDEFLQRYEVRMTQHTTVFEPVATLLDALDARALRWGIVTNKAMRFAAPLARSLGLAARAAVLVGGDTTPYAKPHPAPLLAAAERAGVAPTRCAYVGDDPREVQAGRAAGMATVAVRWGYLGLGEPIEAWGADHVVATPEALLNALSMA